MDFRKILNFLEQYWQPTVIIGLCLLALCSLMWFNLGSLPGGVSQAEEAVLAPYTLTNKSGIQDVLSDPINLPYNLFLYLLDALNILNPTTLRWISTIIAMLAVIAFYSLLKKWHTDRVAILGTILFTVSSWFLHVARFGTPDVLYLLLVIFFFAAIWLQLSRHRGKLLAFLLFSACLLLYVPGLVWFVLLGGIWQRRRIWQELSRVNTGAIGLYAFGGLIVLFPLIWAVINDTAILKTVLGLPETLPSIGQFAQNLASIPRQLFVSGFNDPQRWIPGLPLLDIFSAAMFIVGLYWYGQRFRLDRAIVFLTVLVIGSLLIALGGPVSTTILLPFVYLIVTAGITYMLSEWFTVFPRNPIARTIGTTLVTIAVLLTAYYHMTRYYIAWPNTPETKTSYQQEQ